MGDLAWQHYLGISLRVLQSTYVFIGYNPTHTIA